MSASRQRASYTTDEEERFRAALLEFTIQKIEEAVAKQQRPVDGAEGNGN